ncbi:MAG: Dipeptide transport system permease protein DppB [Firmicutes bacterium ADurb.Bin506]|nr:MAG: Dipeptide transport system permease protein DppB [Firmicutes bacterium ADurb.Bin506]
MFKYVIRRLLYAMLTVLGVVTIVFILQRTTGDPIAVLLPADVPLEEQARFRAILGLDQPLHIQYVKFLMGMVRGDLGYSYRQGAPALTLVLERVPPTLKLAAAGMAIAIAIGLPAGVLAAVNRGTALDRLVMSSALVGQAMPVYWTGILLILLLSVRLRWLPAIGYGGVKSLIMPALAVGSYSAARIARMTRSSMLDVLRMDYVRTARSKGLNNRSVVVGHALRNALIPIVTVLGMEFGSLMGGSVIVETVFAWPGVGRLAVNAIMGRDYPVVQAVVIVVSAIFVLINLGVDLTYGLLDPRISIANSRKR